MGRKESNKRTNKQNKPVLLKKIQVPSYFAFGKRLLSVLQARIRNNCSNSNNDLFNNHLRDDPLCSWCNETEDGEHYFFHCNKYRNERHQFFEIARDFEPLTINILIYDNETLDNQSNIELWEYCGSVVGCLTRDQGPQV